MKLLISFIIPKYLAAFIRYFYIILLKFQYFFIRYLSFTVNEDGGSDNLTVFSAYIMVMKT